MSRRLKCVGVSLAVNLLLTLSTYVPVCAKQQVTFGRANDEQP